MFFTDAQLEYLSSPAGIDIIILAIIIFASINVIFIAYSVRNTYGLEKEEREKQIIQRMKIDKLSPKMSSKDSAIDTMNH